jgi:hypothetical protein
MSFRRFGGKDYAAKNNFVSNYTNTTNQLSVTQNVGQPNSYIQFLSEINGNLEINGALTVKGNETVDGVFIANGGVVGPTAYFSNLSSNYAEFINSNTLSDYRIKESVVPLDDTFTVDHLNPVTYKNTKTQNQEIGLIAHELQKEYPCLVNGEKDAENLQSVNYVGLIPILIKEIQDLKRELKALKEGATV